MGFFRYIAASLMLCVVLLSGEARAAANHITARLVSESLRPTPGRPLSVAIVMEPEAGWHGYWKNPGDAGMETRAEWTLPAGVKAGELAYPVPSRLLVAGLMNHVYEARYAHLVTLDIPAGLAPGTPLPVRLALDWLACSDTVCVPERATLSLDLVAGDGAVTADSRAAFDRWRAALPRPLGQPAQFVRDGKTIRIGMPLPADFAVSDPHFFALTDGALAYAASQLFRRAGDRLVVEVEAAGDATPDSITGVLATGDGQGFALTAAPGAVPRGGEVLATGDGAGQGADVGLRTILASLGAAIVGGILLNVMPCVFPILSLKALSLAKAGETPAQAKREALAYSAGVILVCVGLGAALLALRSGGAALGWAFQLQDPRVILLLLLLVATIGFNLAGLFELPMLSIGSERSINGGLAGAFWTGALAAFVATPCTGPFMAAALGAALVLPPLAAIAIFFGLGLGIALPFLALAFIPALRRLMPRPGAWMATMRHILSVPMFVTALGLAWILGRQAGVDGMSLGVGAVMLLGLALWWGGARQRNGRTHPWLPVLPLIVAALAAGAVVPDSGAAAGKPVAEAGSETFSESRLAALRAQGKPVFLYFTADWCLTCKVNEQAAIDRDEVRAAFQRAGIVTMVGDWTRSDPDIGRFLQAHGRSGVPLYLFYPAEGGAPQELPQVLTPGLLTALAE